jgi:hypothetical protein
LPRPTTRKSTDTKKQKEKIKKKISGKMEGGGVEMTDGAGVLVNTYTLDDTLAKLKLQHHQEEAGEGTTKRQAEAVNKIDLCKQFLGPEGAQTLADALTRASLPGDAPPTPLASARSVLLGADEVPSI